MDSDPFLPLRVVPIDMCPHTLRSELVLHFKRFGVGEILSNKNDRQSRAYYGGGHNRRFKTKFNHRMSGTVTASAAAAATSRQSSSDVGGLLNYLKKIEERAYQEGLAKGLERKAFQMGYTRGLQCGTSDDKLPKCSNVNPDQ